MRALPVPRPREPILALIPVALLLLFSFGVFGHDLWTPDEPRVAAVARQVAEGAWVVPTLNGKPFLEQPPLYAWCVAIVYRLFGYAPPEIGRVVSALAGIGGLVWTYLLASWLARRSRDARSARRIGLLAALALALSLEYLATAHRVVVDGVLTFWTTGSAYAILRGLTTERLAPRLGWLVAAYSFASLAFLAKGAIGLAVPGLAFLALAVALRDAKVFARGHLWLAPLCFLAIAGPWFYLLYRQTGYEGFEAVFVDNTIGRIFPVAGRPRAHTRPIYYYCIYLPVHLMPATLFLAGAVVRRWRRRRGGLDVAERTAYDFSLAWLGAGFVMLSLAMTKRAVYLVPLFPAAAIAGGFWLEAFIRKEADGMFERIVGFVLAVLLGLLAIALPVAAAIIPSAALPWAIAGAAAGVTAAAGVWIQASRGRREPLILLTVSGLVVVLVGAVFSIIPGIDAMKSLGPVSRRVAALVPADRPICALEPDETTEGMIPFYTGRPLLAIDDVAEVRSRLAAGGELYLLTVDRRPYEPGTRAWEKSRFGSVADLPHDLLLEDVDDGMARRAFRLIRLHPAP